MKRIISLFLAICIFASAFPLTAFADSKEIITTEPINVRFVCSTDNGNAVSNTVQMDFQICDGTVMGNLKDLCTALGLEYSRTDNNETKKKIEQLQRLPNNDYVRREIRLLRESLKSDGAVVRKNVWGEQAFIAFVEGDKSVLLSSFVYGMKEFTLPEAVYVDDNKLWVPLDAFLYMFGCEYYVDCNGILVIKESALTSNDIADSKFVVTGAQFYDVTSSISSEVNMTNELKAARSLQFLKAYWTFDWVKAVGILSESQYEHKYGDLIAKYLCCSDEKEWLAKYDYVTSIVEQNELFGIAEDHLLSTIDEQDDISAKNLTFDKVNEIISLNDEQIIMESDAISSYVDFCGNKLKHSRDSELYYVEIYKDVDFSVIDNLTGLSSDLAEEIYNSLSTTENVAYNSIPILCTIGSTLIDIASALDAYERVNLETTESVYKFVNSVDYSEYQAIISESLFNALVDESTLFSKCGGQSIAYIAEKVMECIDANASGLASQLLISYSLKGIPGVGQIPLIWTAIEYLTPGAKDALDTVDNLNVAAYSTGVQAISYIEMQKCITTCDGLNDIAHYNNSLAVSLKSGYISRTNASEYIEFMRKIGQISNSLYSEQINSIEADNNVLTKYLAVLELETIGFDYSEYGKRLIAQEYYNEYLISKLFPDMLPPDGPQSSDDLPMYIVFTRSEKTTGSKTPTEKLIRYDLSTGEELVLADNGTSYWDEDWNENPTELVGGIDGIQLSGDNVYFYSVGIDGIAVYYLYSVDIDGEHVREIKHEDEFDYIGNGYCFYQGYYAGAYRGYQLYNDTLYYMDMLHDNLMARISDTEEVVCIEGGGRGAFCVYDGKIYYNAYDHSSSGNPSLTVSKLDGSNPIKIADDVTGDFTISDNILAYTSDEIIRVCNISEDNCITQIYEAKSENPESSIHVIYATADYAIVLENIYDDTKLKSFQTAWCADSSGKYISIDIPAFVYGSVRICDNWLYFINENDNKLYRCRLDGTDLQQVSDVEVSSNYQLYFKSS